MRRHVPSHGNVADVGCAQGNLALSLAEAGYLVDAYDLNSDFLAYGQQKHDRGEVRWHNENAFDISDQGSFDGVIVGELVEHVAHPEELLTRAVGLAKVNGIVVVTTPNGEFVRSRLPSYEEVLTRGDLPRLEEEQFGPGGEHHLFAYSKQELLSHVPPNAEVVDSGYLGTALMNSHVQRVLDRRTLGHLYTKAVMAANQLPPLARCLGLSLVVVLRRTS